MSRESWAPSDYEEDAEVLRRRSAVFVVGPTLLGLGIGLFLGLRMDPFPFAIFAGPALLPAILALLHYRSDPTHKGFELVQALSHGVQIGDRRLTRTAFKSVAWLGRKNGVYRLRLVGAELEPTIHVHLRSLRLAKHVQAVLSARPAESRPRFSIRRGKSLPGWLMVLAVAGPPALLFGLMATLALSAWWVGLLLFLWTLIGGLVLLTDTLTVGEDGIRHRWMGREHFIPAYRIAGVTRTTELGRDGLQTARIELTFRNDGAWDFSVGGLRASAGDELFVRLRQLIKQAESKPLRESLLLRDVPGRGRARLARLRLAGSGAIADHRQPAITPEMLWEIIEGAGEASDRLAAAIALLPELDREGRQRLVRIARDSASLDLAADLAKIADSATEEAELVAMLDAAAEEGKPKGRMIDLF